ncbi:MAG: type IV pilus modification protein PilV [Pseudomonadota bacterium]
MIFRRSSSRGFSLIEVLVTFIVLSVGLLGLAALHANGLKNNQSAYWRSQATILAYGIIDAMRSNRDAARNGDYNIAITDAIPTGDSLVDTDVATWLNGLATLPIGDGAIDCDTGTAICTVDVLWDDSMGEGGGDAQQFRVVTQL